MKEKKVVDTNLVCQTCINKVSIILITFRLDLISIMVNIERILLKLYRVKKLSQ